MSGSDSVFVLMLLAGLAGGLGHCSAMCGPLVILLAPKTAGAQRSLSLHLGRLLSYALVGGGIALLTSTLASEVDLIPTRRLLMLAAGLILLLSGLATLGLPFLKSSWLQRLLGNAPIGRASKVARRAGPFGLGLFWGLMPCGLLYSAYAAAAGAGATAAHPLLGALKGGTVMVLFAAGTLPTLLGIGWAAEQLPSGARTWLQRVAGVVVAVSGILLLVNA